mgnify:CR=1 FL=1
MSLNKTLDRLFDEIRREAKRNPAFADRLDAVLRLHQSRREVSDAIVEDLAQTSTAAAEPVPAKPAKATRQAKPAPAEPAPVEAQAQAAPPAALNPAGLYKREGEDVLTEALAALDLEALRALVEEHNLDPSGATAGMDAAELVAHIVAQAKRRAERDEKMFDY